MHVPDHLHFHPAEQEDPPRQASGNVEPYKVCVNDRGVRPRGNLRQGSAICEGRRAGRQELDGLPRGDQCPAPGTLPGCLGQDDDVPKSRSAAACVRAFSMLTKLPAYGEAKSATWRIDCVIGFVLFFRLVFMPSATVNNDKIIRRIQRVRCRQTGRPIGLDRPGGFFKIFVGGQPHDFADLIRRP